MKILYVTTIGRTMSFFKSFIHELIEEGNAVDIATNDKEAPVPECYREWNCKVYQISCTRSAFCSGNLKAVKQLKELVLRNGYDIVHCHTPIAAVCTRIACRGLRKNGVKVIYTAHGFHFFKGAPMKNWLVYYPVEKFLSRWTDCLITINKEDYRRAKKKFHAGWTEYVPGVGIDLKKIEAVQVNRQEKRNEIGIPDNAYILLSVGELSARKNHKLVLRALCELKDENIYYAICGQGEAEKELKELSKKHGLESKVCLLGYRSDVIELCKAADLFVFPSLQEGLPVALMEAMACGVPCIASDIRGNRDLFGKETKKYLLPLDNIQKWSENIKYYMEHPKEAKAIKKNEEIYTYSESVVIKQMKNLYGMLLNGRST